MNCTNIIDSFIDAILETAFIADENGDSAFDLFFRIWNVPMRIVIQTSAISNVLGDEVDQGNWKIRDIYEKSCLLLKAANFRNIFTSFDDTCLLHSVIREESCYWAFCKLILDLHPEQILKRDGDGNLPIHIITAARNL